MLRHSLGHPDLSRDSDENRLSLLSVYFLYNINTMFASIQHIKIIYFNIIKMGFRRKSHDL